jgi:hypothetical protein
MSSTDFVNGSDGLVPLKVAMVAPPYFDIPPKGYGGIEAVVADLADALVGRGHDVTLLGAGEPGTSARFVLFRDSYRSRTRRKAASTRRNSSNVRWPELSPRRLGSIAAVCSASTRVSLPAISTSGRKLAARADVEVGATNHVDNGRWSD